MDSFTRDNNLKVVKEELNRSIAEARGLLNHIEKLEKLRESLQLTSSMKNILKCVEDNLSFDIKISDEGVADKMIFYDLEGKQVYGKIYMVDEQ